MAQTHSKIIKVLNIASHVVGNEASNTHNKIWAIATAVNDHLSFDCLSCTANTTHTIHDIIDSIQKTIIRVSNATSGLNIIMHHKIM